jgi:hypothetical protein
MPSGLFFSNNAFQSASKIITKVYSKTIEETNPQYPELFNDYGNDPQRGFLTFLAVRGLTLAQIMPEGTQPTIQQIAEGESQTFNLIDYALGYAVTKKAMEYDPKALLSHAPKFLAYSAQITEEQVIWQIPNLSFTVNGYDGVPLFSTAHPLQAIPSVTVSNSGGTTALSVEALHAAYLNMNLTVDDQNLATYRTPKTLLVGTGLSQVAEEILGSKGYPYSDENRPNVVADSVKLMVSRWITLPTAWMVFAGKGDVEGDTHSMFYTFQVKDRQRTWQEPATENMFHSIQFRVGYGNLDWRGAYGSQGS